MWGWQGAKRRGRGRGSWQGCYPRPAEYPDEPAASGCWLAVNWPCGTAHFGYRPLAEAALAEGVTIRLRGRPSSGGSRLSITADSPQAARRWLLRLADQVMAENVCSADDFYPAMQRLGREDSALDCALGLGRGGRGGPSEARHILIGVLVFRSRWGAASFLGESLGSWDR